MNYNSLFEVELRKLIDAEVANIAEKITHPAAVMSYEDYKYELGRITSLRSVYELCDEVNHFMSKR